MKTLYDTKTYDSQCAQYIAIFRDYHMVFDYHLMYQPEIQANKYQGPVVQSVISLTSSLRVISLTVLADSIYNILIFFAEKI